MSTFKRIFSLALILYFFSVAIYASPQSLKDLTGKLFTAYYERVKDVKSPDHDKIGLELLKLLPVDKKPERERILIELINHDSSVTNSYLFHMLRALNMQIAEAKIRACILGPQDQICHSPSINVLTSFRLDILTEEERRRLLLLPNTKSELKHQILWAFIKINNNERYNDISVARTRFVMNHLEEVLKCNDYNGNKPELVIDYFFLLNHKSINFVDESVSLRFMVSSSFRQQEYALRFLTKLKKMNYLKSPKRVIQELEALEKRGSLLPENTAIYQEVLHQLSN